MEPRLDVYSLVLVFHQTKNIFCLQNVRVILTSVITMVTCNEIPSHWCVPMNAVLLSPTLITGPITTALGNNSAERAAAIRGEGFFLPV